MSRFRVRTHAAGVGWTGGRNSQPVTQTTAVRESVMWNFFSGTAGLFGGKWIVGVCLGVCRRCVVCIELSGSNVWCVVCGVGTGVGCDWRRRRLSKATINVLFSAFKLK